ncbi:hypothetical protein ZWY2020_025366 [Hordeum vulgare]|nr:hypothetical protein ZWY2020_025366 [Hordeum vulgare]
MEKISPETRAIYEFLRADSDVVLAKTTSDRGEAMVSALAKIDTKLDLFFGRIDDVKLAIGVDIDELRGEIGADRSTHVAPSSALVPPREPPPGSQPLSLNNGAGGSQAFRPDLEQRNAVAFWS